MNFKELYENKDKVILATQNIGSADWIPDDGTDDFPEDYEGHISDERAAELAHECFEMAGLTESHDIETEISDEVEKTITDERAAELAHECFEMAGFTKSHKTK